ncbi:hypothetical protein AOLI_G00148920 [Acnodon oligacanthus]
MSETRNSEGVRSEKFLTVAMIKHVALEKKRRFLFPVQRSLKPCPQFVELNQNYRCPLRENKLLRSSKMIHPWFAAESLR